MKLILKNKITKEEIVLDELVDSKVSNFFFNFNIELPNNTKDGEYEYQLIDNDKKLASGLVIIGDYVQFLIQQKENQAHISVMVSKMTIQISFMIVIPNVLHYRQS